jgi:hypothetical protein
MSDYPKLPAGHVYLGKGGTFKPLPAGVFFRGYTYRKEGWVYFCDLSGDSVSLHYCAPADSEIVKLNAKPEPTVEKHAGFIVWSAQRGEPTKIHATRAEADTEAQRLAAKHPNNIFCVCEISARYQATVSVNKL